MGRRKINVRISRSGRYIEVSQDNGQSSKEIFNKDSGKSQLANHPVNSWTKLCSRVNSVFRRLNTGKMDFTRRYVFWGESGPMGSQWRKSMSNILNVFSWKLLSMGWNRQTPGWRFDGVKYPRKWVVGSYISMDVAHFWLRGWRKSITVRKTLSHHHSLEWRNGWKFLVGPSGCLSMISPYSCMKGMHLQTFGRKCGLRSRCWPQNHSATGASVAINFSSNITKILSKLDA